MNDLLQTQLEQTLTTAIEENDINTQIVLHALLAARPTGLDGILASAVQQLAAKVLYPRWMEIKEQIKIQSN